MANEIPVTFNELQTLSGIDTTQSIQSQLNSKEGASLTNTHIFVGNASNVPTDVAVSGDATIDNTGALTVTNAAVIGKVLTGYVSGAGTVAATDTILQAVNKLNGNIAAISSAGPTVTISAAAATLASFTTGTYTDTGATVTITTAVNNQKVFVSWQGRATNNDAGSGGLTIGLSYSGSTKDIQFVRNASASAAEISIGTWIIIATAGSNVIKMQMKVSAGTWDIVEDGTNKLFQVAQYQ